MAATAKSFRVGDRISLENLTAFAAWTIARAELTINGMKTALQVALPNLNLSLHTQNTGYVELVRQRVFGVGLGTTGRGESCHILVVSPNADGFPTPPAWANEVFHPRHFETALAATPFRADFNREFRFWQIMDLRRNVGVQWMLSDFAYPKWEPGSPLRAFLHWIYSDRGLRLAHAGTLGKGGKGVLLVGRGGSGKSGTVVGGVLDGMQTIGDDYILVDNSVDVPTAYPIFRTLKQDARGLERLGLYDAIASGRRPNWQGKFEFALTDLGVSEMPSSLEIKALILPRVSEAGYSELVSLPRAKAMLAAAPSGLFQMPGERDRGVAWFAKLVRSVPCFSLRLGRDRGEVLRAIGGLLEDSG